MELLNDNQFKEFLISIGGKVSNYSAVVESYFNGVVDDKTLYNTCVQFLVRNPSYYKLAKPVITGVRPRPKVVYILKNDGVVVYVGKTTDIVKRLETHYADKDWDEVFIYELSDKESQSIVENTLIAKYRPKYNKLLNIQEDLADYYIDTDPVNFIDWVCTQECVGYLSGHLQERLGVLFSFKGYILTAKAIMFGFYLKESPSSFVTYEPYVKVKDPVKPFCERLQELIQKFKGTVGHEEISQGVHRIGDIVITNKGRWRHISNQRWYFNADLDKIDAQLSLKFTAQVICPPIGKKPMWFGKYKGKTVDEIREIDPQYINWMTYSLKPKELMLLGLTNN